MQRWLPCSAKVKGHQDGRVQPQVLSVLTRGQIKALVACLPSLQCGPRTHEEHFDQMWCKGKLNVRQQLPN